MIKVLLPCIFIICTVTSCRVGGSWSVFRWGQYRYVEQAEELLRQEKFEEASEAYRRHVEDRLAAKNRPQWENPYFYYLIIGDIKLRSNKVTEALAAYEFAEKQKVEPQLVSDRFRYVAQWYEKKGDLKSAMEILTKYRERDPLLFDAVLDRMAKELTTQEDRGIRTN